MTHSTGKIGGDPGVDIDQKISQALAEDEKLASFGADGYRSSDDQSLFREVSEAFRGRQRWLNLLGAVIQLVYLCICVWSAYRFFGAEATREQILFATGFLATLGVTIAFKIWFWMVLNRNALLREVKRLELQVARLATD